MIVRMNDEVKDVVDLSTKQNVRKIAISRYIKVSLMLRCGKH